MSLGDITILDSGAFGIIGAREHQVASGTTASISAGELVLKSLGSQYVTVWTAGSSAKPVVGTDFLAGLAATSSTETASADGIVSVFPLVSGVVYLGNPDTAATWDTQAEYNALIGDRVLLACTAGGVQTILATDGSTQGLVIEPLDIKKYPGKVAFSLRAALSYTA